MAKISPALREQRHPDKPRSQELNMDRCEAVPAAVWQKLGGQGDAFQKLRKASFRWRLGEQIALRLSPCCRNVGRNDCTFLLFHGHGGS